MSTDVERSWFFSAFCNRIASCSIAAVHRHDQMLDPPMLVRLRSVQATSVLLKEHLERTLGVQIPTDCHCLAHLAMPAPRVLILSGFCPRVARDARIMGIHRGVSGNSC